MPSAVAGNGVMEVPIGLRDDSDSLHFVIVVALRHEPDRQSATEPADALCTVPCHTSRRGSTLSFSSSDRSKTDLRNCFARREFQGRKRRGPGQEKLDCKGL